MTFGYDHFVLTSKTLYWPHAFMKKYEDAKLTVLFPPSKLSMLWLEENRIEDRQGKF